MKISSIQFDITGKNTELCKLGLKWHTDKVPAVVHSYTPYYAELLVGRTVKKMLEIGIGSPEGVARGSYCNGASLHMWQDYLPDAEIWALDIRGDILVNEGRIRSLQCDQNHEAQLRQVGEKMGGNFDFIVDDGSHVADHIVLTAKTLFPLLNSGGVYVIEDVMQRFLEQIVSEIPYSCEVIEFSKYPVECDDRLVVIRS